MQAIGHLDGLRNVVSGSESGPQNEVEIGLLERCEACYATLSDDLNTAQTLAVLFDLAGSVNALHHRQTDPAQVRPSVFERLHHVMHAIVEDVLGLRAEESADGGRIAGLLELIIDLRAQARKARDFKTSDQIRDALEKAGIRLKDGKEGATDVEFITPTGRE